MIFKSNISFNVRNSYRNFIGWLTLNYSKQLIQNISIHELKVSEEENMKKKLLTPTGIFDLDVSSAQICFKLSNEN